MNVNNKLLLKPQPVSENFLYSQGLAKRYCNQILQEKANYSQNNSSGFSQKGKRKQNILKWIETMPLNERIKLITIENKWFSCMIQQIISYYNHNCQYKFLLKPEEESPETYFLSINHQKELFHYEMFKYQAVQQQNNNIECEFLEQIRFFDLKDAHDSFTLSNNLLSNFRQLISYLDFFSKSKLFESNVQYI